MTKNFLKSPIFMMLGVISLLVIATLVLLPDQFDEEQDQPEELVSESISLAGCSNPPCDYVSPSVVNAEMRGDKLAPVPDGDDGAESYGFDAPLNANEVTRWIAPVENTTLWVNSAGKPFWVCFEDEPDSGIADWCSHRYHFQYNAFEGWHWQGASNGDQRIQFRADWDDTLFYYTNVPNPPDHGEKG